MLDLLTCDSGDGDRWRLLILEDTGELLATALNTTVVALAIVTELGSTLNTGAAVPTGVGVGVGVGVGPEEAAVITDTVPSP